MPDAGRQIYSGALPPFELLAEEGRLTPADVGAFILSFEYWRGPQRFRGRVRFDSVRAYRYRTEGHSTAWHMGDTFNAVHEVVGSEWVAELAADEHTGTRWEMHHFLVYLDDDGCYEVVAQSWSLLPEEVLA